MGAGARAASSARRTTDTQAPTAPGKPTASLVCQTTMTLSWTASTDNVGVTGYEIFDDGVLEVDAGNVLTYNLTGLTQGSTSTWTIKAYDAAGNRSAASVGTSVTQGETVDSFSCSNNYSTRNTACSNETDNTWYHSTGTLGLGDTVYTDACAQNPVNGVSGHFYSDGTISFELSSSGVVSNIVICTI